MKPPPLALSLLLALAGAAPGSLAAVTLDPPFTDHAVLQQGMPVPVWGRAEPGESVVVKFRNQAVGATAGADGRWTALLGTMSASSEPADLTAAGRSGSAVLHDVVVGEVWLCSGQSNMEFPVADSHHGQFILQDGAREVAAADHPLIRQFEVARTVAHAPAGRVAGAWVPCSPASVPKFTAVGYFFAREIQRRLGVPVGIIDSTWGGTPIEAWLGSRALGADPAFAAVGERWKGAPSDYPHRPSWEPAGLYNAMISPLSPCAMRGALWYQGESNVARPGEYQRLFTALIGDWRSRFGQELMPFYWVQLAAYADPHDPSGTAWAYLREAQAKTLAVPATGMAVTIDIGDAKTIHPHNKQEVGRRLALIAKARVYGVTEDYSGPVFAGAEREGGAMRVSFRYADNGITSVNEPLQAFELAGPDRKFYPATATISGETVLVRSPRVPDPVAVRYAWSDDPNANLYNGAGLPAAPFRSDDW